MVVLVLGGKPHALFALADIVRADRATWWHR